MNFDRQIYSLIHDLTQMYKSNIFPFPSEDFYFLQNFHNADEEFYFAFDGYMMTLTGYASWETGILEWDSCWKTKAKDFLSCSFFEQYPEYAKFRMFINETDTPDLHRDLVWCEEVRLKLKKLLAIIEKEKSSN